MHQRPFCQAALTFIYGKLYRRSLRSRISFRSREKIVSWASPKLWIAVRILSALTPRIWIVYSDGSILLLSWRPWIQVADNCEALSFNPSTTQHHSLETMMMTMMRPWEERFARFRSIRQFTRRLANLLIPNNLVWLSQQTISRDLTSLEAYTGYIPRVLGYGNPPALNSIKNKRRE